LITIWATATNIPTITWIFQSNLLWTKQDLSRFFLIVGQIDNLAIREYIFLFLLPRGFFWRSRGNWTELLFDVFYYLELCARIHVDSTPPQQCAEVLGDIATTEVNPFRAMGQRVALVYWNYMWNTITWI
jgi:hypothetical protein